MIIDAKRIWISAGYGQDNTFEQSMRFVRNHGLQKELPINIIDSVLVEFFIELKEDELKYRFIDNICPCNCGINKSGTAAIHELLSRMDKKSLDFEAEINLKFTDELNQKIKDYMKRDNEKYLAQYGPKPPHPLLDWSRSPVLNLFRKKDDSDVA